MRLDEQARAPDGGGTVKRRGTVAARWQRVHWPALRGSRRYAPGLRPGQGRG
jgi:hypothetical protein